MWRGKNPFPKHSNVFFFPPGQLEIACRKKDGESSLVTALVSEHVRDKGGWGVRTPGKRSGGHLQPRIQFPGTEMVPGGRYFRICVASASADTASLPSPTGGATTGNQGRKPAGSQAGRLPTLKPRLQKPTGPLRGLAPVGALLELRRTGSRRAASSSRQAPAPPVPSSAPRARVIFLPTQPHAHLAEKARLGTHARTLAGVVGENNVSAAAPQTASAHTGRWLRAAEWSEMSPADHHTDRPSRPPYTPPTNSGGGHVARRSGVSRDRPQQILLPRRSPRVGNPETYELGPLEAASSPEPRAATSYKNTDVPPPLPPPPLIVLPLPKGLGNPPEQRQPIRHHHGEQDPTLSRPSAEHAQYSAALAHSGVRKAREPEPA